MGPEEEVTVAEESVTGVATVASAGPAEAEHVGQTAAGEIRATLKALDKQMAEMAEEIAKLNQWRKKCGW